MSSRQLSQWRTVGIVAFLALLLVVAFRWVALSPSGPGEFMSRIFDTLAWTLLGLAAVAAGKSAMEHLGNGSGLKGVARALLTDAKPGDPPPPAPGSQP